jgi:hypothetical protein
MRSKVFAFVAFSLALGLSARAQDMQAAQPVSLEQLSLQVDDLGLVPEEISRIEAIVARDQDSIVKARAELRSLQARLARLLLEKSPSMAEVERAVKASLDQEGLLRMAQIRRQLGIMEVLGNERWAMLYRLSRTVEGAEKLSAALSARAGKAGERNRALVKILKQIR